MSSVTKIKQKALNAMLTQLNEVHSPAEDRLHNWICDQNDDWLFMGVLKKGKSIKSAMKYCQNKARKLAENGVAVIEDDVVFSWTREYFLNEEKEEPKPVVKAEKKIVEQIKEVELEPEDEQLDLFDFG